MCGIVGAIAERNIVPVLVEGLKRLEYRGYDSAGLAVVQGHRQLGLRRTVGKVAQLETQARSRSRSRAGSASRTRAGPRTAASPSATRTRICRGDRVAVIHNGIIENYEPLKDELIAKGYEFKSETDTEVAAHLIHDYLKQGHDLLEARARLRAALRRRLCAARVRRQGSRAHRRHAHREPARHRARRSARTSSRAACRRCCPSRSGSSISSRATSPRSRATPCAIFDAQGQPRQRAGARDAVGRGRREGAVPALHAQGDLRAAERARATRCTGASSTSASARVARAARRGAAAEGAERAHRRVRHELSRRQRRPLLVRVDRRRAVPGRDRERVPLPQRRRAAEHAVPHAVAVRRDGRHARSAAHGEDGGLPRAR